MKAYNKAVRDKIPFIIRAEGKYYTVKQVSDEEFLEYLELKLLEEVNEYIDSKSPEELADLLEVVFRVAELKGIGRDELERLMQKKGEDRGRFEDNLVLISVKE